MALTSDLEVKGFIYKIKTEAQLLAGLDWEYGAVQAILYTDGSIKFAVGTGTGVTDYKLVGGGKSYVKGNGINITSSDAIEIALATNSGLEFDSNNKLKVNIIDDTLHSTTTTWSSTYLKTKFEALAGVTSIVFVDSQPTTPTENYIYYIKRAGTTIYDIKAYAKNESGTLTWIPMGSTGIDLSEYYKKTEVDDLVRLNTDHLERTGVEGSQKIGLKEKFTFDYIEVTALSTITTGTLEKQRLYYLKADEVVSGSTLYTKAMYYATVEGSTITWHSLETQGGDSATDKSNDFKNNTYNSTNLNGLNSCKLKCFSDFIMASLRCPLKTPITDKQSADRKLFELPTLPTGYAYPSYVTLRVTEPTGNATCNEDKNSFWVSGGTDYVSDADANAQTFKVKSFKKVTGAYVPKYTLTTDTSITAGKDYYVKKGFSTNGEFYEKVETPAVASIGTYYEKSWVTADVGYEQELVTINNTTSDKKIYIVDTSKGYKGKYEAMGDSTGATLENHTGSVVALKEVSVTFNTEYIRKCLTIQKGCYVNDAGKIGEWSITMADGLDKMEIENTTSTGTKCKYGFAGTCNFTPDTLTGNVGDIEATINTANEVMIKGTQLVSTFEKRGLI